jgi:hypothetical protein
MIFCSELSMDCTDAIMIICVIHLLLLELLKILDNILNSFSFINTFKSDSSSLSNSVEFIVESLFFGVKKHNSIEKVFVFFFTEDLLSDFVNSVLELNS